MQLILASNNTGKIREYQTLIDSKINLISLKEAGIIEAIPEPYFTFKENAWAKADYVFRKTQQNCFAEDSGLVVPALNNEPGVWSARYAGMFASDAANNEKLLGKIKNRDNRYAFYTAAICLMWNGSIYYFEGRCEGDITLQPKGKTGFGYDPLFVPKGYKQTFAEITLAEKNKISHRGIAARAMAAFLNSIT
jgi:XTP/dITP diphosphohydrolase